MRILIRISFVLSLALVVAAAACGSDKTTSSPSATPGQSGATPASATTLPASTAAAGSTAAPRPTLTQAQQTQIMDIVSRDANVLRVIQSINSTNIKVVAWANGQGALIGGGVAMTLTQPATVDGEWRSISWDSSQTNYGVTIYTAKLSNITTLNVWVDLAKGAVVGWSPNSNATVETAPVIIATPAIH